MAEVLLASQGLCSIDVVFSLLPQFRMSLYTQLDTKQNCLLHTVFFFFFLFAWVMPERRRVQPTCCPQLFVFVMHVAVDMSMVRTGSQ